MHWGLAPMRDDQLRERFEAIKRYYARMAPQLAKGHSDEWAIHAYAWKSPASGIQLSPIEEMMWEEIRLRNAIFYPQYPVGRYFVDFGNPHAKVAIECDGAKFHTDYFKDRDRQAEIEGMDWTVYRISGWACNRDEYEVMTEDGPRVEPSPGARLMSEIAFAHPVVRGCLNREARGPRDIGEILGEWLDQTMPERLKA